MGQFAAQAGFGVILSSYIIEHRIGSESLGDNFAHRLRWSRSTRRSRPIGYVGHLFTNPLPLAVFLCALAPQWWLLLVLSALLRAAAAYATANWILADPLTRSRWFLIPVQDLVSFAFWIAGFFGSTIVWRGRKYRLHSDGRIRPLTPP